MANRVLVHENGLKVSHPGWNVLTADKAHLLFDSEWGTLGITVKGTVSVANGNIVDIYYGKTFPRYPLVDAFFGQAGWWYSTTTSNFDYYNQTFPPNTGATFAMRVETNRLRFWNSGSTPIEWSYVVWEQLQ